jgi:2-polyprenyl-6-methoxyphenol hydroxylase-like FAD-dependent oxidoreductase
MHHEQALQVDMPRWFSRRVVLLGDACHAGSAPTGQEASLLMSSAYVLADALCRQPTPAAAFESYENQLKASLDRRQALQRRLTKWILPATDVQILLRNVALALANQPCMGWLFKGLASPRFDSAFAEARRS